MRVDLQSFIGWKKMDKKKIDRINELAKLSRVRELTAAEKEEQKLLRDEYIKWFRSQLRGEVK